MLSGPKRGADAIGAARIKRHADDGEIDAAQIGDMRQTHERAQAGKARRLHGIRRAIRRLAHGNLNRVE